MKRLHSPPTPKVDRENMTVRQRSFGGTGEVDAAQQKSATSVVDEVVVDGVDVMRRRWFFCRRRHGWY